VPALEAGDERSYARALRLPHGVGRVRLTPAAARVECTLQLTDLRDLATAVERCRRLLDLDADPVAIDQHLSSDELLAPWVEKRPGIRVPGHVDGFEMAVRAIVGQQISVVGARTIAARLVADLGAPVPGDDAVIARTFPTADALAAVDPETLPMPRSRGRALVTLARGVADGSVVLDRSADRRGVRDALLALPGIGPWTADYIALRALGDPDVFLATDLGVRQALERMGFDPDPRRAHDRAEAWRPWRSYALMHVWSTLSEE
jgi:AraC family transcriptional regulator of adaptative response / DNA-3-methyladenine glycosylase II